MPQDKEGGKKQQQKWKGKINFISLVVLMMTYKIIHQCEKKVKFEQQCEKKGKIWSRSLGGGIDTQNAGWNLRDAGCIPHFRQGYPASRSTHFRHTQPMSYID
jgi:hypothetical protein